ncbi:MAG TPA: rhodanese-like domain-containing protein [Candidatus Paceibacterota bacterium]|nr:rhodanese-like domain-containing protein [Candidatus Paceibacterota bacterium]
MSKTITADELKKKLDDGDALHLVDVLSPGSYDARHVPGAVNVPNGPDFLERFENVVGAPKDASIIVYCSSSTCAASVQAAEKLERAGYTNVTHFKDGLAGWQNAGYAFEE